MSDQVAQLLQALADKLGVTIEYLWPHLVAYTRWQAIGALIEEVIVVAIAATLAWQAPRLVRTAQAMPHDKYDDWKIEAVLLCVGAVIGFVVCVVCALVVISNVPKELASIAEPEARTIVDLVAAARGAK